MQRGAQESVVKDVKVMLEGNEREQTRQTEFATKIRQVRSKKKHKVRKPVKYKSSGSWTQEDAQLLLPDGYTIFCDDFNGRWRVYTKCGEETWSTSKSWGVHGDDGPCVEHCAKEAWARHTMLTGEACPLLADE